MSTSNYDEYEKWVQEVAECRPTNGVFFMSKHTPGPWKLSVDGCNAENNRANVIEGADGSLIVYGNANDSDARLIAAAPELLEALIGLLSDIEEYQSINLLGGSSNHWQITAHAAIAKATGGME